MIDKGLYKNGRIQARTGYAGEQYGGGSSRDRGMGMGGKERSNRTTAPGGDTYASDDPMLAEKIDTVTQKYSGDGLFGGYRNLDRRGQPLMGLAYLGDRVKAFGSKLNPLSILGGIAAGPFGSIIGQGISSLSNLKDYDTLKDFAQGELGMFQPEYAPTVDIRDKFNRVAGIENVNLPGNNLMAVLATNSPALAQYRSLQKKKTLSNMGGPEFTIEDQQKLDQLEQMEADPDNVYSQTV